ncbi:MAG: asparagine synthase (glutamine-hydrolyzing) [Fervidobacterium sp.]|nr:asparagine synthase (glutamine-hydrolyzing) [Fervidobacterium sp.]
MVVFGGATMCGIAGIIKTDDVPVRQDEIKKMTDVVAHRGPDGEGFYFGKNFAFGHRRLAIIDLTDAGKQPMRYEGKNGTYVITYNGEVYNYIELKEELIKDGYVFNTHTDTEVILAAYDKWGRDCVKRFNGMWAFAIYDEKRNEIFLSRDRFGIKPLYYTKLGNYFAFGSEIKQFTVLDGWKAKLNRARAYDFLALSISDHTEETLFDGVYQLFPGFNLVYDLSTHKYALFKWYDLNDIKENKDISFDEACRMFRELLFDSVRIHLRSDVKVGSCLSGGLDSSTLVCVMNRLIDNKENQETVSATTEVKRHREIEYAQEVAKYTGVKLHVIYPTFDELSEKLQEIVWYHDMPFGSTSIFAQWKVFETARKNGLIVMLDGQGADEILAGYHHVYGPFLASLLRKLDIGRFFKEFNAISKLGYSKGLIFKLVMANLIPQMLAGKLRKLRRKESFFRSVEGASDFSFTYKNMRDYRIDMFYKTSLLPLLRYEDRDSMRFSVEGRVPYLDYRLVEFMLSLPEKYLVQNGVTKVILRNAMRGIVPDKVLDRKDKLGFETPENVWMREHGDFVLQKVKEAIELSGGLVSEKFIDYVRDFLESKIQYDRVIWRVLIFGEWIKKFDVRV